MGRHSESFPFLAREKFTDKTLLSLEIHYDLVVTLKSALMTFSLEIGGEAIGSVTATFK